jgi:hypothetical protein
LDLFVIAVTEPGLHHATQRSVQVSVVQQIIGDLGEHIIRVQLKTDLGTVPAGVAKASEAGHEARLPVGAPIDAAPAGDLAMQDWRR